MNNAIKSMLDKYSCQTERDYTNALKEIIQEIALLGLWRAKFFEKAAFYGGTALRILYGLDRFSEDMDFSLLHADNDFTLNKYNQAIRSELMAFGFDVEVNSKQKSQQSSIESAFIKANTLNQLITIAVPDEITSMIHRHKVIKIKMEVDVQPPSGFSTEAKTLLLPIPFSVLTYTQADLLAGKIHALLCRSWKTRVKGRDWYDFYWFISRNISVNLSHLQQRLIQSGHLADGDVLSKERLLELLFHRIQAVDIDMAAKDVVDFLKDRSAISIWSKSFFHELSQRLNVV